MYPVPMKRAAAERRIRPKDSGVPSSSNWKPTMPLSMRTHSVATMAPR